MIIAVIEDNKDDEEKMRKVIENFSVVQPIYFSDSESFNIYKKKVDALITDIDVPGDNGLITARNLREQGFEGPIIFVSWHFGFEHESFVVHPFSFIKKENLEFELTNCLNDLLREYHKGKDVFEYENMRGEQLSILVRDILYFERQKNSVSMYVKNGVTESLKCSLQNLLNKEIYGFHLINKSIIMNFYNVENHPTKTDYIMYDGACLYVSRSKRDWIHTEFLKFKTR